MHSSVEKLNTVKKQVNEIINIKQLKIEPKIIVVTKGFSINKIKPLLDNAHIHFGENKIQEAEDKWLDVKKSYKNIILHMVGKLQTNKVKRAVKLFDYIHSLDNVKLAQKLAQYEKELNKKIKLFIQVNVGEENQKSGIVLSELQRFYNYCSKELSLNVVGLMCIPPMSSNSDNYFKLLKKTSDEFNLKELSMGMSSDFEQAVSNNATYLRLGTIILGERKST